MANPFNSQVGDVGVEIIADLQTSDCAGKIIPLDVSSASVKEICLRKPDQITVKVFAAVFSTCGTGDGIDGSISFKTLVATDLDVEGIWQVSGKVVFPDGRVFRGNSKTMIVEKPVCS